MTYDPGPIHVAGSVFNLRPGADFHSQAGGSMTWEAYGTEGSKRRWRCTMQLTPIDSDGVASPVKVRDLNPSATAGSASGIRYRDLPQDMTIASQRLTKVGDLATVAAASLKPAFTIGDFSPNLTAGALRTVTKGL